MSQPDDVVPSQLYRQLCRLLKEHDCTFIRQGKGDHEIWESPINGERFTVDRGGKKRHTANITLKAAGIKRKL